MHDLFVIAMFLVMCYCGKPVFIVENLCFLLDSDSDMCMLKLVFGIKVLNFCFSEFLNVTVLFILIRSSQKRNYLFVIVFETLHDVHLIVMY